MSETINLRNLREYIDVMRICALRILFLVYFKSKKMKSC